MSELQELQDAFMKADAAAQQGNPQAALDAKMFADELRRLEASGSGGQGKPMMSEFNRGAANVFDSINPFNRVRKGINEIAGTDMPEDVSAVRQLPEFGVPVAQGEAEGLVDNFARGAGEAGAILPLVTLGAGALATTGNRVVAGVADDVYRGLNSLRGSAAEVFAGGLSRSAGQATEDAGYPALRPYAEVAAPVAAGGAAILAGRGAGAVLNASERLPLTGGVVRAARQTVSALAPMTGPGARGQAREELVRQTGGEARAQEMGQRIKPETELGLTPAQQTGDPNLLALERAAAEEQPQIREALDARDAAGRTRAQDSIDGMSGDVSEARGFFKARIAEFKTGLQEKADLALQMGDEAVDGVGPRMAESTASANVVTKLKASLEDAKSDEAAYWQRIDQREPLSVIGTVQKFDELVKTTSRSQKEDIPGIAVQELGEGSVFRENGSDSAMEVLGLYSKLRQVARTAMAGNDKNANKARIANELAESILNDLGAIDGSTPFGRSVNEARAFSAAMHETFDQGTVGRILNRTIDGDERISPQSALQKTVGRGGVDALVDSDNITSAASDAGAEVADYIRGRFSDSIINADGEFAPKAAAGWLRKNRELLNQYPEVRAEFYRALGSRKKAEGFAARAKVRADLADRSAIGEFNRGQDQKAVSAILTADNPAQAARSIAATARKDKSGKALAGVKAAFTDYLIGSATKGGAITGKDVSAILGDAQTAQAMRAVFSQPEVNRFKRIAEELGKMDAAKVATPKGPVMDSAPAMILNTVARIAGAKAGAKIAGGPGAGPSLQAAQLGSSRAVYILERLTNDRARRILYDAVQDPELMRALLLEPKGAELPKWATSKLTPYLAGAASQSLQE